MAFLVIIILAFIGILVWQFIETKNAVATTSVLTRYSPEQAAEIIDGAFGGARSVLWTNVRGVGAINKRRRGFRGGITMSIDIKRQQDGVTRIDMWASETLVYLGVLVNFAGVVNRRKRAIARLLAEPDTEHLAGRIYGNEAAPAPGQGVPAPTQQGIDASEPGTGRPYGQAGAQPYNRMDL